MSNQAGYGTPVHRWTLLVAIALTVLVADQATKLLAVRHLTPGVADAAAGAPVATRAEQLAVLDDVGFARAAGLTFGEVRNPCRRDARLCPEVKVFEGFWSWRYAENKGAAWSMLGDLPDGLRLPVLIGVSLFAVVFLIGYVRKLEPDQGVMRVALALVLGGALGNLVDRAYLGYVVDFILWYYDGFYWPTFNVADVAISTGVGLILLSSVLDTLRERRQALSHDGVAQH